jgi:hypothetical protein
VDSVAAPAPPAGPRKGLEHELLGACPRPAERVRRAEEAIGASRSPVRHSAILSQAAGLDAAK